MFASCSENVSHHGRSGGKLRKFGSSQVLREGPRRRVLDRGTKRRSPNKGQEPAFWIFMAGQNLSFLGGIVPLFMYVEYVRLLLK